MISSAAHSRWHRYDGHLGFGFHWFSDQRLGRLVRFFCVSLGATVGRFLSFDDQLRHWSKIAATAAILYRFRRLEHKHLGRLIWFFDGLLGLRLEEGLFRTSVPPLIQNGRYGRHLGFGFHSFSDQRLGRLVRFFCVSLGATGGMFLSMTSAAAHPTWPLRQPSWN
jgi:hypothetical protein